MKEVSIFIRITSRPKAGGSHEDVNGIILYRYGEIMKERYIDLPEATTPNQGIILAATEAIHGLKGPCNINLYTQTNFGFRFMENEKEWVNREFGSLLVEAIASGEHEVNYIDCASVPAYQKYQNALRERLKKHLNSKKDE